MGIPCRQIYVCFTCRLASEDGIKTLEAPERQCRWCRGNMVRIGVSIQIPEKEDVKSWKELEMQFKWKRGN